nr:PREDICTED: UDP-glycosyltransferase 85A5-like [Daucus carota subsp. sativus]
MENTVDLKEAVPHIVCMPFPGQGHITPMLTLAKLLHNRGFYITFVHTDFSYRRSLRSLSPVGHSATFRFETIPDGLPPPESPDDFPHVIQLCVSTSIHSLSPFRDLVTRLNNSPDVPPVTCIISDATMSFTLDVSQELGIPNIFFWTVNAFTLMCYLHFSRIRNLASQLRQGKLRVSLLISD